MLWIVELNYEGANRTTPYTASEIYDPSSMMTFATIEYHADSIYECENKEQMIKYYHSIIKSHTKDTLIAATKAGYLKGFPVLNAEAISKYIDVKDETEMGHMKQIQQGVRSTTTKSRRGRPAKLIQQSELAESMEEATSIPTQEPNNEKTYLVYMSLEQVEGYVASDKTGKFPRTSNKGMKYICVFYIHGPNFIKVVPLKSRRKEELLRSYKEIYAYCESRVFKTNIHKMDNETSKDVEDFIESQQRKQQYTPPNMHRGDPSEQYIKTYKSCMKSTFVSLPPTFPIAYW